MSLVNFFDKEAVGGQGSCSSDESTNHEEEDHDDNEGEGYISNNDDASNAEIIQEIIDAKIEGLPPVIPDHQSIIRECLHEVFRIDNHKAWQVMLIHSLVFDKAPNERRVMYIRKTGDGKSLHMQCAAVMRKHVTIIIVHILSIGSEQSSGVFSSTNPEAGIYAEHLDSVREKEDISQILLFLDGLTLDNIHTQTILLYVSPITISNSVWSPVLAKLINRGLVHLLCIDECHYITSAGRHFRPEFHINIREIVGLLWNKKAWDTCST